MTNTTQLALDQTTDGRRTPNSAGQDVPSRARTSAELDEDGQWPLRGARSSSPSNVARVFGELYFLLEYRDQPARLLYREQPFTLPSNLFLVAASRPSSTAAMWTPLWGFTLLEGLVMATRSGTIDPGLVL